MAVQASGAVDVTGAVAPGFEEVRDVFARNFTDHGDVGAAFCVYQDGAKVVDLAGGLADPTTGRAYGSDTLQLVYSVTKGMTAVCALLLVQRGELDLDAPVSKYWPEFAAQGKGEVPVRWLLTHQSGVLDVDGEMSYEEGLDWDTVVGRLAAATPVWEPGTRHGYHAVTYGYLVGEIVRRVSGRGIGQFFRDEVAEPLGLDAWIGLPAEQHARVAPLQPISLPKEVLDTLGTELAGQAVDIDLRGTVSSNDMSMLTTMLDKFLGPDNLAGKSLSAPGRAFAHGGDAWNDPRLWSAEIPAANGMTTAGSLARMYASLVTEVDGVRLFTPETLAQATTVQVTGPDAVIVFPIPFGLGFMKHSDMSPLGSPSAFGHYGFGGAVGFADPERGLGAAYTMNQMQLGIAGDPRTGHLIDAVYRATA